MPRKPSTTFPSYPKKPHSSGQARIRVPGRAKPTYLGVFGSPASWAKYQRELDRWRREVAAGGPVAPAPADVETIDDLVCAFLAHAEEHYRRADGGPKTELANFGAALKPLLMLYADLPVGDFKPKTLEKLQKAMATGSWRSSEEKVRLQARGEPLGWCKRVIDRNIVRIRTMFRWAEKEELVPEGRWHALRTVRSIDADKARVTGDVPPVPEGDLTRTLPELRRIVRAMVELQLLCGARPSEVIRLRPCDFQRHEQVEIDSGFWLNTRGIWVVELAEHKTARLKHRRFLFFGPQAQAILQPFLLRDHQAPLFSPAEAAAEYLREAEKNSTASKGKDRPKEQGRTIRFQRGRQPGTSYRVDTYGRAIKAACLRAGAPVWTPYQLRHSAATRLVKQFGWDVARIVLGHRSVTMTRKYAPDDLDKAVTVIREVG